MHAGDSLDRACNSQSLHSMGRFTTQYLHNDYSAFRTFLRAWCRRASTKHVPKPWKSETHIHCSTPGGIERTACMGLHCVRNAFAQPASTYKAALIGGDYRSAKAPGLAADPLTQRPSALSHAWFLERDGMPKSLQGKSQHEPARQPGGLTTSKVAIMCRRWSSMDLLLPREKME